MREAENDSKVVVTNDFNAPHSFLYLHPNENSIISLVSPVLESHNYHSWSKSFAIALGAKNKMEFIDGIAPEPDKIDPTYQAWRRCNNMVVSWLTHSVSPSIRQSILWMDKFEEIQKDLKSRFFQGNLLRILELQLEASSLKQGNLSITEYFIKICVIWDVIFYEEQFPFKTKQPHKNLTSMNNSTFEQTDNYVFDLVDFQYDILKDDCNSENNTTQNTSHIDIQDEINDNNNEQDSNLERPLPRRCTRPKFVPA